LNGFVKGYDDIFGTNFHFNVINNEIFLDYNTIAEDNDFDDFDSSFQNLEI
jgi:hypothetical protein